MSKPVQWILKPDTEIPAAFQEAIGGHPLVAQTLFQRGYQSIEIAISFMDPSNYDPTSPDALPDIQTAYQLLSDALKNQKRILVWGDFDVDGQTATTILVQGLRELGGDVIFHIPVRAKESHGITRKVLEAYLSRGFDLLLTCDTGISEYENIQVIRDAGLPVIITDHHTLPASLPPANAVINPQRLPKDHPLRTLPGVGVAYKLIEGLHRYSGIHFDPGPYLELTALGIVADVAELKADTRFILQTGLSHLRHTQRVGLKTLYTYADLNPNNINEGHIGFQIAPRLNAIGRLADANPMVEFLTTDDPGRARVLGMDIEATNAKRRFASRQVEKAAESMLQNSPEDRMAPAIVLHHPDWPGGVIGPVASRLVERYQKPVLLLTGKDPIHGSGRSVEGINITEIIRTQVKYLNNFGGHPMAAGLSMLASNFDAFKRGFLTEVEKVSKRVAYVPKIEIDRVLHLDEISMDLIDQIERLAPFGAGFPPLKFLIEDLRVISYSDIGQTGEHRQVMVEDENGNQQRMIWWNGGDAPLPEAQFDLVCSLSKSDYRGTPQINAEWIDFRLSEQGLQEIADQQFEIRDQRQALNPKHILQHELQNAPKCLIWLEGNGLEGIESVTRIALRKTDTLVIWTAPPSQEVLKDVLLQTKPKNIVVFGVDPGIDHLKLFLERLAGLAKYAVRKKNGQASIDQLAAACAAQTESIRIGLKIWEARGHFKIGYEEGNVFIEMSNAAFDHSTEETYLVILAQLLEETQAYRRFFQISDLSSILKN
jgi:single-stranded-DNA-specific exonuclease